MENVESVKGMDTIPEAIYQVILSFLLEDNVIKIFQEHHSLQFINKTFKSSFIQYLKTKPLRLILTNWKYFAEFTLQVIQFLKKYDISIIYDLTLYFFTSEHHCPARTVTEAMYGIKFKSLRK